MGDTKALVTAELIETKIYFIRGQKVILDSDLAELFCVETKRLNEQVKRNLSRFPEDFMFQLTKEETQIWHHLRSQFATLKRGQHLNYLPYAFTEHGAIMVANVLNSPCAIDIAGILIPVPPRALQNQCAAIVEKVESLKSKYTQSLTELENLYGSLSQRAFKGELDLSRVPLEKEMHAC